MSQFDIGIRSNAIVTVPYRHPGYEGRFAGFTIEKAFNQFIPYLPHTGEIKNYVIYCFAGTRRLYFHRFNLIILLNIGLAVAKLFLKDYFCPISVKRHS
jgi:hypothetical protein